MTGKSKLFGLRRPGAALVCGGLAPLSYATFNPLGRGISGLDQSGAGPPHSREIGLAEGHSHSIVLGGLELMS